MTTRNRTNGGFLTILALVGFVVLVVLAGGTVIDAGEGGHRVANFVSGDRQ